MNSNTTVESPTIELKTEIVSDKKTIDESSSTLPKLTIIQLLKLCIGFIGIQFAWNAQIVLSSRVTEPLGATPLIFGLIWLAGPITGILVQPVIGVISDNIWTFIGRRRPFLIVGTILGSLGLLAFPHSLGIAKHLGVVVPIVIAASFLWIIDASVNISQGPYRALVPDVTPPEQHALANSFISFAIGIGSVVASFTPIVVKNFFHYSMSVTQQFAMAAIVFVVAMAISAVTISEKKREIIKEKAESALEPLKSFGISAAISLVATTVIYFVGHFNLSDKGSISSLLSWFVLILSAPMLYMALKSYSSKEAYKLCAMQFFTWLGIMSMFIYFNNYVVHNIYHVPDLSTANEATKAIFATKEAQAIDLSLMGIGVYNLICLLASIPLGVICGKLGKKNVHALALLAMSAAFFGLGFINNNPATILVFMGLAGIGWASVLALPFALLTEHIPAGTEGSAMGKFNLFVAGPQILSSVAVGYLITTHPMAVQGGSSHHWEYAFIVAGISVLIAAIITQTVKEKSKAFESCGCGSAH